MQDNTASATVHTDEVRAAAPGTATDDVLVEDVLVEDVLVEEVSIDGMCGVY